MTDFFAKEQAAYPDIAPRYQQLQDLHARKLYHELTGELEAFVRDPMTHKYPLNLVNLYQEFIRTFQDKLNQIRLVSICSEISTQFADPAKAQAFMEQLLGHLSNKTAHEAVLLCTMQIALLKFRRGLDFLAEVKTTIDENKPVIESLVGAEPVVHAAYYRVACDYYSALGPADKFYKNALMFLAYTQYDDMRPEERFDLAVNISIAALTGDGVFNFGEVLATPILGALENTDKQWLSDLLHAFNKGDIDRFNEIVGQNSKEFNAQPALVTKQEYVKEKVALLALMVLVFQRPSHERNISFREIAEATRLPQDQVEWVVMRALSCKLIKGSIDQVDGIVRVTWVQPRVLDNSQLQELVARLDGWEKKVNSTLLYVEEQTPELFQ
uniref:PCI domain-containing protein n=1 Tax=Peronospora matthiolae TaxID=2874970 RepID=A0AAV1VDN3_9STRA